MSALPYEVIDDIDFQLFISINACTEYRRRLDAFLSSLSFSKPDKDLQEGLSEIRAFEKSTSDEWVKLMGKLSLPKG